MSGSTTLLPTVSDAMHRGVISTPPQTPLRDTAALMVRNRVHCVVVEGLARGSHQEEQLVWGILSDMDLVKAAAAGQLDASSGEMAATEILTVEESTTVEQVSQLMAEHECTHLVVVAQSGEPVGVISSLDVAAALTYEAR